MIFIGPNLNDPKNHFVTNVIDSIGSGNDLILDVLELKNKEDIFSRIRFHLNSHNEQYIIYSVKEDENFFLSVRDEFPKIKLIMFFSDDEWRHFNYNRYLALFSDYFTTAVKSNVDKYKSYGLSNVFYMRWGCNPKKFYPVNASKKYNVTFIGAAYGKRLEYVRFLINSGVDVRVFGREWDKHRDLLPFYGGCPDHGEMLDIIGQSKINLNFTWTSRHPDKTTIKGRSLELAACCAFQLSNYSDEFKNYGFVDGENIAVFDSKESMLQKIRYYLERTEERERIAQMCFKHVTTSLTWPRQFNDLFSFVERATKSSPPKFKVLVINRRNVRSNIVPLDARFDVHIENGVSKSDYPQYDGVIELDADSSIDNDGIYMLLFGLFADSADIVISNFYVESGIGKRWVRFERRHLDSVALYYLMPKGVVMFSGRRFSEYPKIRKSEKCASYIEYPICTIETSYLRNRLLRLNYGFIRGLRGKLDLFQKSWQVLALCGLVVDRLWQGINKAR